MELTVINSTMNRARCLILLPEISFAYSNICTETVVKANNEEVNTEHIGQLSRVGLKNPSMPLSTAISQWFAVSDANSPAIRQSNIPARKARMKVLASDVNLPFIVCEKHTDN